MARAAPPPPPPPSAPIEVNLREALEERYLAYALSTIMGRALPDARDGLKPVHRRILYGMHILKLDPGTAFKKCAKIVGDVMGSFHPHGDQAIYEALVRLAQDFSSRYPLVEGQGNFGNIDGDNAAAYRYTEARLTDFARLLMEGIDEDCDRLARQLFRRHERADRDAVGRRRTCSPTARRASPSAWRPRSRRTTSPSSATPRSISSPIPGAETEALTAVRAGPGFPDRRHRHRRPRRRSPRPIAPAAAAFRLRARWDEGGDRPRRLGRRSSPRFPTACRSRG